MLAWKNIFKRILADSLRSQESEKKEDKNVD